MRFRPQYWAICFFAVAVVSAADFKLKVEPSTVTREMLRNHPARKAETWAGSLLRPLVERVRPAPDIVIDHLRVDNAFNGYAERPVAWAPGEVETTAIARALASLPPAVVNLVSDSLVGICFVEHLGGSGFTETVDRTPGGEDLAYMVFDRHVFSRTANAWATWKESTAFREGRYRVELRIAESDAEDRAGAFRFILLHEIGHIIGLLRRHHMSWRGFEHEADFDYQPIAWLPDGRPRPPVFPHRLRYYAPVAARADNVILPMAWRELEESAFPTLYATTNVYDDFAESFASYVHVVMLGAPWQATIYDGEQIMFTLPNGITAPRGAVRRAYFERLLGKKDGSTPAP